MSEQVDLDALEKELPDYRLEFNKKDEADFRATIAELRELRAWKARLGPVETWFPSLDTPWWSGTAGLTALKNNARNLLERAKETP